MTLPASKITRGPLEELPVHSPKVAVVLTLVVNLEPPFGLPV